MDAAAHYDGKAGSAGDPIGGVRSEMRTFHNAAKRAMLQRFASGGDSLLDLACGRGGDIHKWRALGIKRVVGLDVSAHSIKEARARYEAAGRPFDYTFVHHDLRRPWSSHQRFDTVTCMFALHYFFEEEKSVHALLHTVACHLKSGGYFVGFVPDGLQINELIKHGSFDNGVMQVVPMWSGPPQCFGSAYTCSIRDTVTADSSVPEYLVYKSVLHAAAEAHGLDAVPVSLNCLDKEQRMQPPYAGPWADCSSMYMTFAFRRR